MNPACQICASTDWLDLPDPVSGKAVTTAGRIVDEPLGKSQCARCGFTQRIHAEFLGLTKYYESDYASYYDRPGANPFHAARYRVLAEWMQSALGPVKPAKLLDVGCGQGWGMEAMRVLYSHGKIEGIEPSRQNRNVARQKGFIVYEGRMGEGPMPSSRYDLVYSNNVIQHVVDARRFLSSVKEIVKDEGVILITCPDGSVPNIEMLWADQNFSFLPAHLIQLSQEMNFTVTKWMPSPASASLPPAQMLLLSNNRQLQSPRSSTEMPSINLEQIYQSKCDYLGSFPQIDTYIRSRAEHCKRVFNFGASYWSSILAAYCPRYWHQVSACLVENCGASGLTFLGKNVFELRSVNPAESDSLVCGTSPATHDAFRTRFLPSWKQVISWDHFAVQR